MEDYIKGEEAVALFCRINMNTKRKIPIRSSEMGMLIFIVKSKIPQLPIKIAEFFKVTKPMVTTMANSMVKKGYLTRASSLTDGRSVTLCPTKKAIALVEKTYIEYFKTMETLRVKMGVKKYESLIELLEMANSILLEERK